MGKGGKGGGVLAVIHPRIHEGAGETAPTSHGIRSCPQPPRKSREGRVGPMT